MPKGIPKKVRQVNKYFGRATVEKGDRPKKAYKSSKLDTADKVAGIVQKSTGALANIGKLAQIAKLVPYAKLGYEVIKYMTNDPKWYCNYPQLTDAAEGLQFTMPNGLIEPRDAASFLDDPANIPYVLKNEFSVPTVASVNLILTIGDFKNRENAINRIFNALRRVNTGSIPYSTIDIDEYIMNFRLILALHSIGRRAYGLTTMNSIYDAHKPMHYFAASGLDYDTFRNNAALLRSRLNVVADTMKIYAPFSLDLFKRTTWLFNNIFATSDGVKDQEYMFALDRYQKYWDYTLDQGTNTIVAAGVDPNKTGMPFDVWCATLDGIVYAMVKNPVNAVIAGDMAKAFGVNNIHYLPFTEENYKTPVLLDKAALLQIWNADITGCIGNVSGKDEVTKNSLGTMLTSTYYGDSNSAYYQAGNPLVFKNYLNFDFDAIKREDILESTRFQCWINEDTGMITSYGSEIVTNVRLYTFNPNSTNKYNIMELGYNAVNTITMSSTSADGTWNTIYGIWPRSFDYFPKFRQLFYFIRLGTTAAVNANNELTSANTSSYCSPFYYNWSNWCEVTYEETEAINNVAMSSLYYVPLLVKETKDVLAVD